MRRLASLGLGRLRIARKLALITALGVLAVAALAALALRNQARVMQSDRIAATQHLVETAVALAAFQQARAAHGDVSDADARATALAEIKSLRYGHDDYFWINDLTPRMVMHPFKPELVGQDLSGYADPNGVKLFNEAVARVKASGGGYIDYVWPRPGASAPVRKISYVQGFAPWGWVIGSGVYVDDIDAALRSDALVLGALAAGVALALWLLSWAIARAIATPLAQAVASAEAIAAGRLDAAVPSSPSGDETAELMRALAAMRTTLAQQIGDLRRVSDENLRIREAMDNLDTMVRIADRDGRVLYANRALLRLLAEVEPDVRAFRPEFRADAFVGGSIGDIYPDAAAAIERMRNVRATTRVRAPNYGRVIDFVYSPLFDAAGEQCGTIAEWQDVTAQVATENQLVALVEKAAQGDFTQRIAERGQSGVVLALARAINQLLSVTEATFGDVGRVLGALARGDLRETIQGGYGGTLGRLRDDTNATVHELSRMVARIQQATASIDAATHAITADTGAVAEQTQRQSARLQDTAVAMEELTATVKQNADSARAADALAHGASDVARKGGAVVGEVVATMSTISASSRKIADIIGVIDGIAFQTNILALNAAVEAARAGEQGRGFAVVAAEVRNLAQRSAGAAKEIKTLIDASTHNVERGASLVQRAGDTMSEVMGAIQRVSGIMGQIASASQEQSAGIEHVSAAIAQMDDSTQQSAALVDGAAAVAATLDGEVRGLADAVAGFTLAAPRTADAAPHGARPLAVAA